MATTKKLAALEDRARVAAHRLFVAKQRAQDRCKHPYAALSFHEGASASRALNGDITHSMHIKCSLCDATLINKLILHYDSY